MSTDLKTAIEGYTLYGRTTYAKKTYELYEQKLAKILEIWGNREIESITPTDISKLMVYLKTEYIPFRFHQTNELMATPTLANYWKTLRSFFKWANENLDLKRPDTTLSQPKYKLKEVNAFSRDEMQRLLYSAEWVVVTNEEGKSYRRHRPTGVRDLAMLKVMFDTGLRLGELSRVRVEDVDLEAGSLLVRPFGSSTKSKPRMAYLGASTKKTLWLYIAKNKKNVKPSDNLFGLGTKRIYRIITDLGKEANVTNCHPHRFRHTFAIEFLRSQKDPYSLQRLLGHSSMDMTRHYLDILEDDLRRIHGSASPVDNNKL